ncbi:hypothetical protein [Agromyces sp. SYSU T00194]|uniref:hypothetical protein n=1 Tax=Agromyces chitinivorans TaxID=3158560 RepID=UPI0033916507
MGDVHPDAWVSPHAVLRGDVSIGPGSRVLDFAVLDGRRGSVRIGTDVVVMEHAVL